MMRHNYFPTMPLHCPPDADGWSTVFHYPQYRDFPQWPWLYKERGGGGQRKPVDYDKSAGAQKERGLSLPMIGEGI